MRWLVAKILRGMICAALLCCKRDIDARQREGEGDVENCTLILRVFGGVMAGPGICSVVLPGGGTWDGSVPPTYQATLRRRAVESLSENMTDCHLEVIGDEEGW